MQVTIADFGLGNLHSLRKALERLGASVSVTPDIARWLEAGALVLPGDGAFGAMMAPVEPYRQALRRYVETEPTLGICIGMQLLFEGSEEDPGVRGLGVLSGVVGRLPAERLPHMGWNTVEHVAGSPLFRDIPQDTYFYFVHGYGTLTSQAAIAWTVYGRRFVSTVQIGPRSYAVQFHPEKSSTWGLKLLRNFLELAGGE